MPAKEELHQARVTATTAEANLGSAIPQYMRRYIYRVRVINEYNGENELTFGHRLGTDATAVLALYYGAVKYDETTDPDQAPKEDSLPIHIVEGGDGTNDRYIRVVTDNGDAEVEILYVDAP